MKKSCFTSLGLLALSLSLSPAASTGQADAEALVRGNTGFACDLYHRLSGTEGNLFFSPYSISAALAMTYAGARGNTEKEMAATLRFSLSQAELHPAFEKMDARLRKAEQAGIRLSVANALWPQKGYPFLDDYVSLLKRHYGVAVTAVDYRSAGEAARQTINRWVESKTQDRIKGLLQPPDLTPLTRLVLVNAVFFKGTWERPFRAGDTKEAPFHVAPGKTVQAPMMRQKLKCRYASLPALEILELPYAGGGLSLLVLLPKEADGVRKLEGELSGENLARWLDALGEQDVLVFLPRFKASCRFSLSDTLSSMGMADAFSDIKANFAGMDGRPDWLFISAVIHKAFVDVNEEGTEAAAATAVVMSLRSIPAQPPTFRADHPFVFLIRENRTGSILFAGRLSDPAARAE